MRKNAAIWCLATQGADSADDLRVRELLAPLTPRAWRFDRRRKCRSGVRLFRDVSRERPDLVVLEGTGMAGGLALMLARALGRTRYVVSSGDAVAPLLALRAASAYPLAFAYERLLYRLSAGFIGWTPYLVGRALTYGAPRGVTAENWAPAAAPGEDRAAVRARLGIPEDALVFGLVGSLVWTQRRGYCYGQELLAALRLCDRADVRVLIVGDGSGTGHLEQLLTAHPDHRAHLIGRVGREEVPALLAAMDVASLPQSVDAVGSFRYTTKLSEYLAANLPVVTGQLPFAYDLDDGWLWRLPGTAPWDEAYEAALADLMASVTLEDVRVRADATAVGVRRFDRQAQQRRVCAFLTDLRGDGRSGPAARRDHLS